jgi:hypothetical protein
LSQILHPNPSPICNLFPTREPTNSSIQELVIGWMWITISDLWWILFVIHIYILFIYLIWAMSKFSLALSRPCWMRSTNANFLGFSEQMVHQGNYDHLKGYCPSKRLTLWSHFDYLIKLDWFCNYNIQVYPMLAVCTKATQISHLQQSSIWAHMVFHPFRVKWFFILDDKVLAK